MSFQLTIPPQLGHHLTALNAVLLEYESVRATTVHKNGSVNDVRISVHENARLLTERKLRVRLADETPATFVMDELAQIALK